MAKKSLSNFVMVMTTVGVLTIAPFVLLPYPSGPANWIALGYCAFMVYTGNNLMMFRPLPSLARVGVAISWGVLLIFLVSIVIDPAATRAMFRSIHQWLSIPLAITGLCAVISVCRASVVLRQAA